MHCPDDLLCKAVDVFWTNEGTTGVVENTGCFIGSADIWNGLWYHAILSSIMWPKGTSLMVGWYLAEINSYFVEKIFHLCSLFSIIASHWNPPAFASASYLCISWNTTQQNSFKVWLGNRFSMSFVTHHC